MITVRSTAPVEFIHPADPAIDEASPAYNWERFAETLDRKYLPLKPGHEPTVFVCQRLTRRQREHAIAQSGKVATEVVAYGLKDVRGLQLRGADGALTPISLKHRDTDFGQRLDEASLDAVDAHDLVEILARFILYLSSTSPLGVSLSASSPT